MEIGLDPNNSVIKRLWCICLERVDEGVGQTKRVVNGKVRFRVCSNDRQSKVWYMFGWRHN